MRRIGDALTGAAGVIWGLFSEIAVGLVALWAFFVVMGGMGLSDPLWLTIAMVALVILATAHFVHTRRPLNDHEHSDLARRVHMMRERRGF